MYSIEKISQMTLEKRDTLYRNCLKAPGSKADEILAMLEASGLPYIKHKPISDGDPIYRKIEMIINKPENVEKMLDATARGRPALEPIDPLIANALGGDYGSHNESTIAAGYLTGQKMYALGYEKSRPKSLEGCIAKTAATFKKPKK